MVYSSSRGIFDMGSEVWNICMLLWSLLPPYHGSAHSWLKTWQCLNTLQSFINGQIEIVSLSLEVESKDLYKSEVNEDSPKEHRFIHSSWINPLILSVIHSSIYHSPRSFIIHSLIFPSAGWVVSLFTVLSSDFTVEQDRNHTQPPGNTMW